MDDIKIAGKKTIKEWNDLVGKVGEDEELKIDYGNNEKWAEVFEFFEERIKTRYLNPIDAILNMKSNNGEGFAVVNLQCSLIETIESFINGWVSEFDQKKRKTIWKKEGIIAKYPNSNNGKNIRNIDIFISFFENRKPFNLYKIKGDLFFWNVRCSLLHETQTKNGWKILADGVDKSIDNKIIYRNNFQRDLKLLIEEYKKAIIFKEKFCDIEPKVLRENFIAKFNHICTES